MKPRSSTGKWKQSLDEIFAEEDELGLLADVAPKKQAKAASNDPAVVNFLDLVAFVEEHGHEPCLEVPAEKLLAVRLNSYRTRPELRAGVQSYDTVGLLTRHAEEPDKSISSQAGQDETTTPKARNISTLDDILEEDDDLDLLGDINTSIFTLAHVPSQKDKDIPEEIAGRKPCEDFFRYEKLFHDVQKVLNTTTVMQTRFSREETVVVGSIFILRGMLCCIASIIKEGKATAERDNPRLRVIFENGTETDLLKRSLIRALYKDPHGKYVDFGLNLFSRQSVSITGKDRPTGYIYILSSLSEAPELAGWKNAGLLVKIGYSTQEIHERIKNAVNEATYLEAPVKVMASIACYNLNPQKFENLVHAFLHKQRLNLTLIGKDGKAYRPEEWFTVDVQTALEVCRRIIDGSITDYRMDDIQGRIVKKEIKVQRSMPVTTPSASVRPKLSCKALSVRQPWASLIACGEKTVECRSWKTAYRGPLVICASGRDCRLEDGLVLPGGVALCVVELVDIRPMTKGDLAGACMDDVTPQEQAQILKNYAWHIRLLHEIEMVPVKGKLHVFDVEIPLVRRTEGPKDHFDFLADRQKQRALSSHK